MKTASTSLFSFFIGIAFYHFILAENPPPRSMEVVLESQFSESTINTDNSVAVNKLNPKSDLDNRVTAHNENVGQSTSKSAESDENCLPEKIYLPSAKDYAEYLEDFNAALDSYFSEGVDYDWSAKSEAGFYEFIAQHHNSGALLFSRFSCREFKCVLELAEVDFIKTWGPIIGEMAKEEWWKFERIHFDPYPLPGDIQEYTIVFERSDE